ncbi:hypothetical protein V1460_17000 [Streptomyces sp. SCSIO 30461]|uniref:hypothetical protein n=1 Tax=Streptomyces sp. SCSIO 30461 TaxID=3118085 RepID=UPI0030CFF904
MPGQDSTFTGAALTQAAIASQFGMASRRVVQPINGPELAGHAGRFDRLGHSRRLTGYFRVMR